MKFQTIVVTFIKTFPSFFSLPQSLFFFCLPLLLFLPLPPSHFVFLLRHLSGDAILNLRHWGGSAPGEEEAGLDKRRMGRLLGFGRDMFFKWDGRESEEGAPTEGEACKVDKKMEGRLLSLDLLLQLLLASCFSS